MPLLRDEPRPDFFVKICGEVPVPRSSILAAAQELAANERLVRQALDSALQDKNLSRQVQSAGRRRDNLHKSAIQFSCWDTASHRTINGNLNFGL